MDIQFSGAHGPERLRLRFGAPVLGTDGPLGSLHQVLLDPGTLRVIGLVTRSGFLFFQELRVPLIAVISATEEEIRLDWSSCEAAERREKQAQLLRERRSPNAAGPSTWGDPESLVLPDALRVESLHGSVGHVRQLLAESPSGGVTEFVIESGLFARRSLRLPAEWVRSLTGNALVIDALPSAVRHLPPYRADRELRADILDAWFYDYLLRPLLLHSLLDVKVREGTAVVEGHASSPGIRRRLEAGARAVSGVLEVRSAVVTDDELVHRVVSALLNDPRTRLLRPRVYSAHGIVSIKGAAADRVQSDAASEVAAAVPRVRGVLNRLCTVGNEPSQEEASASKRRLPSRAAGPQVGTRGGP